MAEIITMFLRKAPASFHGSCVLNEDDTYTIILDPNDTRERQLQAYMHELKHLRNGDFGREDIDQIEKEAHGLK